MIIPSSKYSSPSETVRIRPLERLHILNFTQSKTRSLPSELLSIIFQYACPTPPDIFGEKRIPTMAPFHLILRLVSTLWYDISQSTPQLWASIFLPKLRAENVDIRARYLKLCLDNSGNIPLTVFLGFEEESWNIGWFISPIVDAALERSAHRIQALRILRPPGDWLEKLIPKMCQLATIHIDNPRPNLPWSPDQRVERLLLPRSSNMNRIYIRCPCLFDLRSAPTAQSITHVEIFELPVDFVMEFLSRCPNLVAFHCRYPIAPSQVKNPHTMLTSPFVLRHLSTFTWSTTRILDRISEWDITLFEHIHFPALTRFNWWPGLCFYVDDTALALPIFRFPTSVTTLQFGGVGYRPVETFYLIHFFPFTGVTQLRLLHCEYRFVDQVLSFLSRGTERSNTLFPQLTSIMIDYRVAGVVTPRCERFYPESGKKLVQMLRSRIGLIDEFTLIVEIARFTQHWNDEVWEAVRQVKRDGINLTSKMDVL
ncbi:hypothetical protein AGABI2DRAFT_119029 [Agaricus bisporus var. bisporus H97]|uniref:hypothetical protein n=1 Tax=Agaricus bisporus var. bisporus (strain H97 / ATCC MYA-4626 / FGSC 10389) TaxID=936046 RepID=UPI00029F7231|nr:hypothetical protein AGABI2DRAFT_119029 [Agaricus bisporus var. bisporus H97]EKV46850.1 hypothetical protein AGABI2DRAFT_119029 [Agaricus bisporus var. bisporus H97]